MKNNVNNLLHALLLVACSVSFVGCGDGNKNALSTPREAVMAFAKAAAAKDVEALSKLVHKDASGEFQSLIKKDAQKEMLDDLAKLFSAMKFKSVDESGVVAKVQVTLGEQEEEITFKKSGANWLMLDF